MDKTALLIVVSPLQAITGLEAIHHFGITRYRMVVLKTDTPRHQHIISFLRDRNIEFDEIPIEQMGIRWWKVIARLMKPCKGMYDYLMIGDSRDIVQVFNHIKEIKTGGNIVFLDDGNATIAALKGESIVQRSLGTRIRVVLMDIYMLLCRIKGDIYFTIFDDVQSKIYQVIPNKMDLLRQECNGLDENIYIVGTYVLLYCKEMGIEEADFYEKSILLFAQIKHLYKERKIIYIPHGRSVGDSMETICRENGVEYMALNKCIELFFIDRKVRPFALYGYGSTALFTLKRIFPSLPVFNVFWGGTNTVRVNGYEEINSYYSKHGIKLIS